MKDERGKMMEGKNENKDQYSNKKKHQHIHCYLDCMIVPVISITSMKEGRKERKR
jgi:hypothetical protein